MISNSSWRLSSSSAAESATTTGPRAKCDQVIFEAISKAAEIVVLNRCGGSEVSRHHPQQRSSGRFNLQTPEIASVRKVLGPFKRSLHVPLRLDVYYQHDANRRELLERWLIEYAPCHSSFFTQECSSQDPLVQLRHVCKKLVIWNRCLYCLAKLLPCSNTKSNRVGFSIYVSDQDRQQDVDELTVNSGFVLQQHSSVYTPYGRLDMECLYAPKDAIYKLFPKQPTARWVHQQHHHHHPTQSTNSTTTAGTAAQPIPTASTTTPNHKMQQQQQQNAAQSAPSHLAIIPNYTSSPSSTPMQHQFYSPQQHQPQSQQHHQPQHQNQLLGTTAPNNNAAGNTNMMNYKRSESYKTESTFEKNNRGMERVFLRSKSNLSDDPRRVLRTTQHQQVVPLSPQTPAMPGSSSDQKRVLSGLSLAMMNADDSPNSTNNKDSGAADGNAEDEPFFTASSPPSPRYEQRRAALHRPPPQLSTSPKMPTPPLGPVKHPGEYGYAYNNHIPWGQLPQQQQQQVSGNGSTTNTGTGTQPMRISPLQGGGETPGKYTNNNMSTSPGSTPILGSTPPQPMFMMGGTSSGTNTPSSMKATITTTALHQQRLLPPMASRNNNNNSKRSSPTSGGSSGGGGGGGEMTPPFAAVPTTLSMPPPASASASITSTVTASALQQQYSMGGLSAAVPLAPQLASTAEEETTKNTTTEMDTNAVPPPISSLDLLQSSPFHLHYHAMDQQQQQAVADGSSKLSSLSGGGAGSYMSSRIFAAAAAAQYSSTSGGGAMSSALWATAGAGGTTGGLLSSGGLGGPAIIPDPDHLGNGGAGIGGGDDEDDMPFAVDPTPLMTTSTTTGGGTGIDGTGPGTTTTSVHLDASTASAAVMARQCSTATRLKLFDSQQIVLGSHDETTNHADTDHTNSNTGGLKNSTTTAAQADMMVASLADQLAEFRSFGASLQLSKDALVAGGGGTGAGSSGGVGSGSDQGSNATPPIALKT